MQSTGWWMILFGILFLGFAAYHYFNARGHAAASEESGASKVFAVSHSLRGVGSLIMGVLIVAGGIIMLLAG